MADSDGTTAHPTLDDLLTRRRIRVHDLQAAKDRSERWAMLTSYDALTAGIFESAGIPVLLVGDSAADNVLGYPDTVGITVDELLPLARAVVRGSTHAFVVADLPFGSYQVSPEQALHTATRFMKEGGVHAIKLEGGRRSAPQIEALTAAGVPVMGHLGFTPQSVHGLGGYRVQGRGEDAASALMAGARAVEDAGAFALVLELVPAQLAKHITAELTIPTIGIGAGVHCDAQVLVWTDLAGLHGGPHPKFTKRYADLRGALTQAAASFRSDVTGGRYPGSEHSYE